LDNIRRLVRAAGERHVAGFQRRRLLIAGFSFTPAHPRPGEEVRFSDESTGEPTSWLWDFGDGQTSQEENPSHTYTTPGRKTVTLVVSNASGSDSAVKELRIDAPPRRPSRRVAPIR
jgi:PKD repeat protein